MNFPRVGYRSLSSHSGGPPAYYIPVLTRCLAPKKVSAISPNWSIRGLPLFDPATCCPRYGSPKGAFDRCRSFSGKSFGVHGSQDYPVMLEPELDGKRTWDPMRLIIPTAAMAGKRIMTTWARALCSRPIYSGDNQ